MKKKEIVQYDNKLNIPLKSFTAKQMDLLMILCSRVRGEGTKEILISYQDFKKLAGYGDVSNKRVFDDLDKGDDKLMDIRTHEPAVDEKGRRRSKKFTLFPTFENDETEKYLVVAVNPEFEYLLNNLQGRGHWTGFELLEFLGLKSKYSKSLYRYLKERKTLGEYTVTIEEFRESLDIPGSYAVDDIEKKVIKPLKEELPSAFKKFEVKKFYKETGRVGRQPLGGYIFTFEPEKVKTKKSIDAMIKKSGAEKTGLTCPECGKPLQKKKINGSFCWCHYDFVTGGCSRIYNEVAEIHKQNRLKKEEQERKTATAAQKKNIEKINEMTNSLFG